MSFPFPGAGGPPGPPGGFPPPFGGPPPPMGMMGGPPMMVPPMGPMGECLAWVHAHGDMSVYHAQTQNT